MAIYKNGLIISKMYPPHLGHLHLINSALEQCEKLTILVCTLESESIPGELRFGWLNEIYSKNYNIKIYHISDDLQQEPYDDEDDNFWDIWTGIIVNHLPNIDCVFTSETYGDELKKRINKKYNMNIDSVTVDIHRKQFPVSGTDIRNDPFKYWDYIPKNVRPYFMRKIIIVGPESTGKSYATKLLAEHYGVGYVDEYGRTYCEQMGNRALIDSDFYKIAGQHARNVKKEMEEHSDKKFFIMDTDYITTEIWAEIYLKKRLELNPPHSYLQDGDLYLIMRPDIPWIDDGTREFPKLRDWHYTKIKKIYSGTTPYNKRIGGLGKYGLISGDYNERIENAKTWIDAKLKDWGIE